MTAALLLNIWQISGGKRGLPVWGWSVSDGNGTVRQGSIRGSRAIAIIAGEIALKYVARERAHRHKATQCR